MMMKSESHLLSLYSVESFLAKKRHETISGCYVIEHLEKLSSFKAWRNCVEAGLKDNGYLEHLSEEALEYFLSLISKCQHIVFVQNKAEVLEYIWPSGERKLMPVWKDQFILQPDLNWASCYPFFQIQDDNLSTVMLDRGMMSQLALTTSACSLMLSHNDHFGHFIADNFSTIALLLMSPLGGLVRHKLTPVSGHKSIIYSLLDLIEKDSCLSTFSGITGVMEGRVQETRSGTSLLAEVIPSSLATSVYIWIQIKERVMRRLSRIAQIIDFPSKVWLVRRGNYETRVSNHEELAAFLESEGFVQIDPCRISILHLAVLLNKASHVICEAGSTTLNAAFFTSTDCMVLSLCSSRLFQRPSVGMIRGGLPYILLFANYIKPIIGKVIDRKPLESSDICYYRISDVRAALAGFE